MRKHYFIALAAMCAMLALLPVSLIAAGPPTFDVNVLNTPGVTIANPVNSPIPVKDVENPAKSPFYGVGSDNFGLDFQNILINAGTIPAGQRLVIEQVTVNCETDSDDNIPTVFITVTKKTGDGFTRYSAPLLAQKMGETAEGKASFTVSQQVRLYSDGLSPSGTAVTVNVFHSKVSSDTGFCFAFVSGYMVSP